MATLFRILLFLIVLLCIIDAEKESYLKLWENPSDKAGEMTRKITDPVSNFKTIDFNDRTSRVQVVGDISYELYTGYDFEGDRMVVRPGPMYNAVENDAYSSGRKICEYDNDPEAAKIIVYQDPNLQGPFTEFYGGDSDLSIVRVGETNKVWGDRISSVHVVKGDWELYEHPNYVGKRWYFNEGEVHSFQSGLLWSDHDRVSSIRPLCSSYKRAVQCTPYKIEILESDDLEPMMEGVEVIGSQSGGTCSNTPTKIYLKCSDGTEKTEEGTMKLRSVTFPSVNYWSLSGKFNKKKCKKNSELPECVNDIRRKYQKMDSDTDQAKVDRDWDNCFAKGKGKSKMK